MIRALFTGRGLLGTLVAILGACILCGFGFWQIARYNQRMAINQRIDSRMTGAPTPLTGAGVDPEQLDYRRVVVHGTFDPAQEILLRNRSYEGITGVHVLTPLHISGSDASVLIDRGWLPMEQSTPEARRQFAPPSGEVTIDGVARMSQQSLGGPADPPLEPGQQRRDAWFRVDIPQIERQVGYPLLPVFVEEQPTAESARKLPLPTKTADLGPGPHISYAIQWFSFAVILLSAYVAWKYQQLKKRSALPVAPPAPQK